MLKPSRLALFALVLSLWTRPAVADDPVPGDPDAPGSVPPSPSEQMQVEGEALLAAGRVDEACARLTESVKVERTTIGLATLARCHEFQGKTASAFREHLEASLSAERSGDLQRAQSERDLAGRLGPRLAKLRVEITAPVPGLVVLRDWITLDASEIGAAIADDPGEHTITARAPGYLVWTSKVKLGAEGGVTTVTIPALILEKRGGTKGAPKAASPAAPIVQKPANPVGVAGFVSSAIGVLGLTMGSIFGVMAILDTNELEEDPRLCRDKRCTKLGLAIVDEIETKAAISTVGFTVGGAALATGVVLLIVAYTGEDDPEPVAAGEFGLAPGPGEVGAVITVAF